MRSSCRAKPATVQEIGEPQDREILPVDGLFFSSTNASHDAIGWKRAWAGMSWSSRLCGTFPRSWSERAYDEIM